MPIFEYSNLPLAQKLIDVLDKLSGLHPGFRPAHAKGAMCVGTFTPSLEAVEVTRAPHGSRASTPVTVRFSNATGVPNIPDNNPAVSGPRGCAIRFHLGEHVHTDIIAHSADGFPVRTGEEFLAFLNGVAEMGAGKPEALGAFLATHPNAQRFVELPKPIPSSFAREAYFAPSAYTFTNAAGASRHGRFRIRPEAGLDFLTSEEAAQKSPNFLFDELITRLAAGPIRYGVFVQWAEAGDTIDDASTVWPISRTETRFGTLTLTAKADDQTPELRKIIYDPIPRVDGIDPTGDPLAAIRADLYLLSGRRRRAVFGDGKR
ncbi:MAG: hypothetical protein AMXMBFR7_53230 [Planctomycetota bacterium]